MSKTNTELEQEIEALKNQLDRLKDANEWANGSN